MSEIPRNQTSQMSWSPLAYAVSPTMQWKAGFIDWASSRLALARNGGCEVVRPLSIVGSTSCTLFGSGLSTPWSPKAVNVNAAPASGPVSQPYVEERAWPAWPTA